MNVGFGGSSVGYIPTDQWDVCRVNPLITRVIAYLLSGMILETVVLLAPMVWGCPREIKPGCGQDLF